MLNRCLFYAVAAACCSLTAAHSQTASVVTLLNYEGVSPAANKGNAPRGGLLLGADGLLYGTTELGGTVTNLLTAPLGVGTIYKFTPSGSFAFTAVADFDSATTGGTPTGQLMLASDGNYYGTTAAGGGASGSRGTVFQLTPAGVVTTVYTFLDLTRANTGIVPTGQLVEGADGYLYGTTSLGGANSLGTIFKILPGAPNTPIRVADFSTATGTSPSPLMRASDGNFYGVAAGGGLYSNGTVFKLTPTGGFTTLANFGNLAAAATGTYTGPVAPSGALIQAKDGILYGTSSGGGTGNAGTVFSVTTAGVIKTIVNFTGTSGSFPGNTPDASLMQATDGYLYGTTKLGGTPNRGTIFRVSTAGTLFKSLAQFTGGTPVFGASPRGALVQDNEGHLFGTTSVGGANNLGTIFRLDNALPDKASIATGGVTNPFGGTRATVTGSINPQGTTTTLYWFEYGLTSAYGSRAPLTSASAGAGKVNLAVQTTLTGLTPSTTYHYRLVATNGGGIVWGSDEVFVTGPNPTIVTPPADQLVGIGSPFAFDVDAVGVTLSYLWFQNGVSKAVTTHNYSVVKAALTNAGNYTVRVSDGLDSVITAPARLGVISVADTSMIVNEADPLGATLALPNAGPGMTFQWKTAAGNVVDGGRITGAQTASLKIANPNGTDTNTYFCTVSLGSLTLDSGNFNLTIRLVPVMNMPMLGPWTVNGSAFGSVSALNSPTSYTAIGLPPGVVLNATTGVLSGHVGNAPNVYTLHLTATNLAGKSHQLDYAVTVLPALAGESGSFAGIVTRDGTANNNLGGGINFNLTSTGSGSGKLTHLGKVFSFTTALSNAPGATRDVILTPTAGQVGFPAVVATLTSATGDVVGTVNGGAFTAKRNLTSVPLAQQGRFNIALSTGGMQIGDVNFPQGSGYLSLVIDAVGNVTWSSELSDGTKGTGSSVLPGTGVVSLHQALYLVGTGSAQVAITIANDGSVSSGNIDWLKTTQTGTTRSYKTGFALHTLDVLGSKYVKPSAGTQVIGLTTGTALFSFTQGGLSSTITQSVNFPTTNVITVPLPNANTVKVTSLDLTTGIFLGSFVVPAVPTTNTRTAAFAGILLQASHQGIGHFNLATLPAPTTSPMLSGRVVLN